MPTHAEMQDAADRIVALALALAQSGDFADCADIEAHLSSQGEAREYLTSPITREIFDLLCKRAQSGRRMPRVRVGAWIATPDLSRS